MIEMDKIDDPFGLMPVWRAVLDVYKHFALICEQNGFQHWAAYGTLLGIVRHKGFIPWDDDFDVFMPRADYNRFLAIADRTLPSHLKLVTWKSSKSWNGAFAKVQDVRRDVHAELVKKTGFELVHGIFIDVIPLDYAQLGFRHWLFKFRFLCFEILNSYRSHRGVHQTMRGKFAAVIGPFLAPFYPIAKDQKGVVALREKIVSGDRFFNGHGTGVCRSASDLAVFPVLAFKGSVELPCMDIMVRCPSGYDQVLRANFGDYMRLPPEESRVPTHVSGSKYGAAPWAFGDE